MSSATSGTFALQGDCLAQLSQLSAAEVDLVYLDPPFFTNRRHFSTTRDRSKSFSFEDLWGSFGEYTEFMALRLKQVHRILKDTGSVFVHCDTI